MKAYTISHGIPEETMSLKDFKEENYAVTNTCLPAPWKARNQETRGDALTQPIQMRTGGNTERR